MISGFELGDTLVTRSEAETRKLGERLARALAPDGLLLLYGDMGMGKTVLVKGMAEHLSIDPARVQSPTFTLLHEYSAPSDLGSQRLIHVDLYRLEPNEVEASGVLEAMEDPGAIKVIEWSERLPFDFPGAFRVRLEPGREESSGKSSQTKRVLTRF